jgi:hypothetical protein
MTCKKKKAYMQKHNLLQYWLLPLEYLQEGTRYRNSIPGDSPELMPLDEMINMDIQAATRRNVTLPSHLPNDDQKKLLYHAERYFPRLPPPCGLQNREYSIIKSKHTRL